MVELAPQMPSAAFTASMTDHILLLNSNGHANGLREGLIDVAQIDPAWSLQLGMECIRSVEDTLTRKQISETWRARFKAMGEAALETMLEVFPRDSTQDLSEVVAFISDRAKNSGRPDIQQAASALEGLYSTSTAEPQNPAAPIGIAAMQPAVTVLKQVLPTLGAQSFQGFKGPFVAHLS